MIVQTMVLDSIMPFIGMFMAATLPRISKQFDNSNPYNTKKTSMFKFKQLWYGGEYVIHSKQSEVLNTVFVTLLYGMGMPILYPIAAINFVNQYICDRYVLAYHMRLPPSLDDTLM